jgi:hypothetical protein
MGALGRPRQGGARPAQDLEGVPPAQDPPSATCSESRWLWQQACCRPVPVTQGDFGAVEFGVANGSFSAAPPSLHGWHCAVALAATVVHPSGAGTLLSRFALTRIGAGAGVPFLE